MPACGKLFVIVKITLSLDQKIPTIQIMYVHGKMKNWRAFKGAT
jgi:hypothetical protein